MFTKEEKKSNQELSSISNIIGRETLLEGSIESIGNIRIEGKVVGNTKAKAKFVMGANAVVDGDVLARNGEVAGKITGNITISELLILKPSAVINGDILTNKLVVEPGAIFNGGCKMGHLAKDITIAEPETQRSQSIAKGA